jgi:hypothetical protein
VQDAIISTCFCFGSGHAAGTLSLDGSAYPAGATLNLAVRVQNSTKKSFKTIRVRSRTTEWAQRSAANTLLL